jgi:hypothetical protein
VSSKCTPPPPTKTRTQTGNSPSVSATIFRKASSKQQAASSKQQAASSKQQAASSKQQAASSKQQAAKRFFHLDSLSSLDDGFLTDFLFFSVILDSIQDPDMCPTIRRMGHRLQPSG